MKRAMLYLGVLVVVLWALLVATAGCYIAYSLFKASAEEDGGLLVLAVIGFGVITVLDLTYSLGRHVMDKARAQQWK